MSGRRRQSVLGARLREMYENVIREDVPEDFLAFLAAADAREGHDAPRDDKTDDPGSDDDEDRQGRNRLSRIA